MSEPKFKIGQRVQVRTSTIFGLIKTEGKVVGLPNTNYPYLYWVALDGIQINSTSFNGFQLKAI